MDTENKKLRMDINEIKVLISRLSNHEREKLFKNLKKVSFGFKINISFLTPEYYHPITIPREFYEYMDIHGISSVDDATLIFPDGSIASAYIRFSRAGYGPYYQIKIRGYAGVLPH